MDIEGDFDGDGRVDRAALLVSKDGSSFGLFVAFASGRTVRLLRMKRAYLPSFGIAVVHPGAYATACGNGYWACTTGEASRLSMQNEGIAFFKSQSAASVYVWMPRTSRFSRVWVSD